MNQNLLSRREGQAEVNLKVNVINVVEKDTDLLNFHIGIVVEKLL